MEILTTKDLHSQLNTWMIHEILLGDVFFGLADAAAEFLAATDGGTFFILQVDLGIYYLYTCWTYSWVGGFEMTLHWCSMKKKCNQCNHNSSEGFSEGKAKQLVATPRSGVQLDTWANTNEWPCLDTSKKSLFAKKNGFLYYKHMWRVYVNMYKYIYVH